MEPRHDPPPLPPNSLRHTGGRLRDVGPVPPPPGQGSPPPPHSPPGGPRHPGAGRHWAHAPRLPGPSLARSHSDLGKLQRQPACQPARQAPAGTRGHPWNHARTEAHGHEPEQYGDHTLHGLSNADEARLGARSSDAEGRTEAEQPPAPSSPGAPNHSYEGGRQTDRSPTTSQALNHHGHAGPPKRQRTARTQARAGRDRPTPPK